MSLKIDWENHAVGVTVMCFYNNCYPISGDHMMGKSYQRKNNRSRRKMQKLDGQVVTVNLAGGKAAFQMVLPMSEMLFDAAKAIEQTASQAGLLMMKALTETGTTSPEHLESLITDIK